MNTFKIWIVSATLLIASAGITVSCADKQDGSVQETTSVSAVEFEKAIKNDPDAVILDVRTPDEFVGGHIKSAVNINYNDAQFRANAEAIPKTAKVYIYCRSGARSAAAAKLMRADGFSVIELEGGLMDWNANGLPVETGGGESQGMNLDEFNNLLNSEKLVLVDFHAEWCGPCKRMKPFLEELSTEMAANLDIVRIDVDENPTIASNKNIEALPTLHAYRNGKLVWSTVGFVDKASLAGELKKL